jgi:aldose 1-epimerase
MPRPPSGQQHVIRYRAQQVTIVEVGGGIRSYRVGDRDVLQPYSLDAMCDGAHGAPLIPWPNRLGDGRYRFDGTDYQVALTEPDKHNAIHGFMHWRPWQATPHSDEHIVMEATLYPLQGYPFLLDVQIDYCLDETGLSVTTTATNNGDQACPYGCGQHPYLSPGSGLIDDCTLRLAAHTRIVTDPQWELPVSTEDVTGTAFDFRTGRRIGDLRVDYAFTDLDRDADGRAWVSLTGADGRATELWVDEAYPIIELYTADTLQASRRRRGLGTEPMTCPPNAFQTGMGVIRLEPGQTARSAWGARLRA